ncbi:hypothetical protein ODJ79_42585 [Actinoplanes sp. KI2]|uniref:hypothetical protein n=1 Tax=Actinoplanes sp. KI2 TaxID=2983315 RepID=UPI0021D57BC3|nr:hypothetical protein [Actinoplanes sp. KI2]MCU7730447.1 hypothetical protein [Actinoplanes sp. KI2]
MVNVVVQRSVRRAMMIVVAAGALGLLAFAADAIDGFVLRQVVTALVSSGLAWGLAAVLAGRTAPDRRAAVVGATALLVSATLVYYLLILVVSRRWSGGSPGDWYGLRSLAVMTTAWLLVSMVAGPSLGLLGRMTRTAPMARAALAAGVACGLLSGQGWQEILLTPPGLPWAIRGPDAVLVHGIGAVRLVEVIVPLAVLAWLATRRRLWRAWPVLFLAMVVTATLSALFWRLLGTAANHLG